MNKVIDIKPHFVTVKDAVKCTGLSEHFIRANLRCGNVPHIMVGKKYLINLPLFENWLEEQSRAGGSNGEK